MESTNQPFIHFFDGCSNGDGLCLDRSLVRSTPVCVVDALSQPAKMKVSNLLHNLIWAPLARISCLPCYK